VPEIALAISDTVGPILPAVDGVDSRSVSFLSPFIWAKLEEKKGIF
jgi:hypothetical protein